MAKKKKNIILVAVDFTPYSEEAIQFACKLAECTKAEILILHVIHDPAEAPGFYSRSKKKKKFLETLEEVANEMMTDFLKKVRKGNPNLNTLKNAATLLVVGTPVTRIIEVAKKKQASQIILGSHGRTGLSHILIGSKAERVVQLSPIPVTVVKMETKK